MDIHSLDSLTATHLTQILQKDPSALGAGEIAFLKARVQYLTATQKEVFSDVLNSEAPEAPKQVDLRRSRSYRALQAQAKELGIKHVAVSREQLERDIDTALGPQ